MRSLRDTAITSLLALVFCLILIHPASASTVRVTPSSANNLVGETLSLTLEVDSVADLAGFQAQLSFDPAILEVQSSSINQGFGRQFINQFNNLNGTVRLAALSVAAPPIAGASLTLATLTLKVITAGVSDISVSGLILGNVQGDEIQTTAVNGRVTAGPIITDPPTVTISSPAGPYVRSATPDLVYNVSGGAVTVKVDGTVVPVVTGQQLPSMSEGSHTLRVESLLGKLTGSAEVSFIVDTVHPTLTVDEPLENALVITSSVTVSGSVSDLNTIASLTINGKPVQPGAAGSFNTTIQLAAGANTLVLTAQDAAGNDTVVSRTVTYNVVKAGDCNSDGKVTIDEVQRAINMYLMLEQSKGCVDTNNSGNVSIDEVQKVINMYLGL